LPWSGLRAAVVPRRASPPAFGPGGCPRRLAQREVPCWAGELGAGARTFRRVPKASAEGTPPRRPPPLFRRGREVARHFPRGDCCRRRSLGHSVCRPVNRPARGRHRGGWQPGPRAAWHPRLYRTGPGRRGPAGRLFAGTGCQVRRSERGQHVPFGHVLARRHRPLRGKTRDARCRVGDNDRIGRVSRATVRRHQHHHQQAHEPARRAGEGGRPPRERAAPPRAERIRDGDGGFGFDHSARAADPGVPARQRDRRLRLELRGEDTAEVGEAVGGQDRPRHRRVAAENGGETPRVQRAPQPGHGVGRPWKRNRRAPRPRSDGSARGRCAVRRRRAGSRAERASPRRCQTPERRRTSRHRRWGAY
jgi:hypothetical protein